MTPSIFAGLSGPNNVKGCGDARPATQLQRACLDFKIVLWLFVFVQVENICVVPSNLPGWRWAGIKQLALVGSSSSLHSEACKALGGSDGVIHSRISDSGGRVRANTNRNVCLLYPKIHTPAWRLFFRQASEWELRARKSQQHPKGFPGGPPPRY